MKNLMSEQSRSLPLLALLCTIGISLSGLSLRAEEVHAVQVLGSSIVYNRYVPTYDQMEEMAAQGQIASIPLRIATPEEPNAVRFADDGTWSVNEPALSLIKSDNGIEPNPMAALVRRRGQTIYVNGVYLDWENRVQSRPIRITKLQATAIFRVRFYVTMFHRWAAKDIPRDPTVPISEKDPSNGAWPPYQKITATGVTDLFFTNDRQNTRGWQLTKMDYTFDAYNANGWSRSWNNYVTKMIARQVGGDAGPLAQLGLNFNDLQPPGIINTFAPVIIENMDKETLLSIMNSYLPLKEMFGQPLR